MKKSLHVICFDNPFPANYGGAIDVYYRLKELKRNGVSVTLHVYTYGNRQQTTEELLEVADELNFYPRKTGLLSNLSFFPYIVFSRRSDALLQNLLKDKFPILFEGLHSCYLLNNRKLSKREKWVRMHNVEHDYYQYLRKSTSVFWKKAYYFVEATRLRFFEHHLSAANSIFAISTTDKKYFENRFPKNSVDLLPCFTNIKYGDSQVQLQSISPYFLYHGNLEVAENEQAVFYLIDNVLPLIKNNIDLKIAGKNPSKKIIDKVAFNPNLELISNPDDNCLDELIANAKANVLITFQPTGIKLKLLNALYQGGFCVVNNLMLQGTDLDALCIEANTPEGIARAILSLSNKDFTVEDRNQRLKVLSKIYSNSENVKVILKRLNE
jgi:glycosyltransferase involved in cell wall biosynthesis